MDRDLTDDLLEEVVRRLYKLGKDIKDRAEMDRDLTDDLLEEVLRRLPRGRGPSFVASTADVSLVSKRWLRLYRSTTSALSLRLPQGNSTPHALSSLLSHFPNISSLSLTIDFRHRRSISLDQILLSVASSCPKLTHLSLPPPNPVSRSSLLSLSTSCPHLTSLHIALSTPCSFHWLLFFHSLKHLNIFLTSVPEGSEPLDAASEGKFDGQLELETLSVSSTLRVRDYDLDWLWKSCKKLKKLHLNCCRVHTSTSSFVNCLNGLQEVELIHHKSVLHKILSKLVDNCETLSSLLVVVHKGCEFEPYDGRGLLQFITHRGCNLRKLDLHLPRGGLKDDLLLAVAEKCTGLSSLRLRSYWSVTGEGLKTMMLAMSNIDLEELALVECTLKPGLVTILGQKFQNLRFLDLSWGMNDVAVEELTWMLTPFNCLRELKLRGLQGWTNASIVSMSKSCKQLEIIDITSCPDIEAESVELFIVNCPRLKRIHVEESKLSDVSKWWVSRKLVDVFHT